MRSDELILIYSITLKYFQTKENYQQTKVRILTICFGITSTSLLINYDSFDQDIISKYKSIEVSKVVMDNGMCQTYVFYINEVKISNF